MRSLPKRILRSAFICRPWNCPFRVDCGLPLNSCSGPHRNARYSLPVCCRRRMYTRFGAFVEGAEVFDSGAFRLPHAEAAALDPQARILLEQSAVSCPWRAQPDAQSTCRA